MGLLTYLIGVQLLIIQSVHPQCVNRIVQGPNGPIELLPNQVLIPPGVQYLGQGQQVFVPGPAPPCQSPQPIVVPTPAPIPEYSIPNIPPVNFAPPPNILSGNVIVPNIPTAIPNVLSGNVIVPNLPSAIPNVLSGNAYIPNIPSVIPNGFVPNMQSQVVQSAESYAPALVHDNSVANSLANALQLLVVSNLLSNTLPDPFSYYDGYTPYPGYLYK